MAPACHVTQFEDTLAGVEIGRTAVVMTLTPAQELADSIIIAEKSLLWAIHNLFEANWKAADYRTFRIPLSVDRPFGDLRNTALLGLERLMSNLENRTSDPFDRAVGGRVVWAASDQAVQLAELPSRVWTRSTTHGGFGSDATTIESLKLLLDTSN